MLIRTKDVSHIYDAQFTIALLNSELAQLRTPNNLIRHRGYGLLSTNYKNEKEVTREYANDSMAKVRKKMPDNDLIRFDDDASTNYGLNRFKFVVLLIVTMAKRVGRLLK